MGWRGKHQLRVLYHLSILEALSLVVGLDDQVSLLRHNRSRRDPPGLGIPTREGAARVKPLSLIAAGAVVLIANTFALLHAARNRSGEPESEIVLTQRELTYYTDPDDSGVS